jgi:uncharacterized protein
MTPRIFQVILLLTTSNAFMTIAWYGHLQLKRWGWLPGASWLSIILLSWALALPEYACQVPANRLGYRDQGGPFTLFELKTLQEVISLTVFTLITVFIFRTERLAWNHLVGFSLLVLAVFFVFHKWERH